MEEEQQQQQEQQEPQYTDSEKSAMASGWLPKDQWQGDPEDWIPAKQYLRNGELFGRINTYKHKIQHLEKSVDALVKHNEKVFEAGYKAAEAELKAARKVALQEGDHDRVEQIEEKIDDLKKEHEQQKTELRKEVAQPQAPNPAWEPWLEQNQWYAKSAEMRGFADGAAREIVETAKAKGVEVRFEDLLTEVGRKVKSRFPENFATSRSNVNTDTKDDAPKGRRTRDTDDDIVAAMSPVEHKIMDTIVAGGVKREEYIKQYKQIQNKGR